MIAGGGGGNNGEGNPFARIETLLVQNTHNLSHIVRALETQFPISQPVSSYLSVAFSTAGGTTIKTSSGWLRVVSVTTPSTGATALIYDANSPANVGSSNIMVLIPSSGILTVSLPFTSGLTVQPSSVSSHTVSIFYV